MKKYLIIFSSIAVIISCYVITMNYKSNQVIQVVSKNNSEIRYPNYDGIGYIYLRIIGTKDSIVKFKSDSTNQFEIKRSSSPYKLITKYKEMAIEDFGTFREIDSLKCIRYNQMVSKSIAYEIADKRRLDSLEVFSHKIENELNQLNKPCK